MRRPTYPVELELGVTLVVLEVIVTLVLELVAVKLLLDVKVKLVLSQMLQSVTPVKPCH